MDIFNFNIGVLGHVDSGKTSLSKALSTVGSTASFDKNPQSAERGITLDLGFSSFLIDTPDHLKPSAVTGSIQVTLVDCPGHASLIRTIIGGAQIMDAMILVIDAVKGFQTQTAECLVIGEITCNKMLVVINKIDMYPAEKRDAMIEKMKKKLLVTLQKTKFKDAQIVPVAAKPSGADNAESIGVSELLQRIKEFVFIPNRTNKGSFVMSVDHCFGIRGQGTILTGTIQSGGVAVGDTVEIPSLQTSKKVKSLQMFRKPVEKAQQGDRVGLCVTQFEAKSLERGIITTPGTAILTYAAILRVNRVPYYKQEVLTKSKMHITIGHETSMAKVTFFGYYSDKGLADSFSYELDYLYQDNLIDVSKLRDDPSNDRELPTAQFCLLEFEKPIYVVPKSLMIASKFDTDIHSNICRLAFYGNLLEIFENEQYKMNNLPKLKVFKEKRKEGVVERLVNEQEVIVKNLLKKETNVNLFCGLKVKLSTGEQGFIESSFGQSGKVKVRIPDCLLSTTQAKFKSTKKKGKENSTEPEVVGEAVILHLNFRRFVFDLQKKMSQ